MTMLTRSMSMPRPKRFVATRMRDSYLQWALRGQEGRCTSLRSSPHPTATTHLRKAENLAMRSSCFMPPSMCMEGKLHSLSSLSSSRARTILDTKMTTWRGKEGWYCCCRGRPPPLPLRLRARVPG